MADNAESECLNPRSLEIRWFERRNGDHTYVLLDNAGKELKRVTLEMRGTRTPMFATMALAAPHFAEATATLKEALRFDVLSRAVGSKE